MSKILTREERLILPDWEEVETFLENPVNQGKSMSTNMFLSKETLCYMLVSKLTIAIYTCGLGMGSVWQPTQIWMYNKNNYDQACDILTKIWKGG